MIDDEAMIAKVMATTGIDRGGAEQALVDGRRLAVALVDGAEKPKRRKGVSPSARTLERCRKLGWEAGVVERRIPFPRPRGTTLDLFGVIDIIAIDPAAPLGERTIGIQATTNGSGDGKGGRHAEHRAKILAEPRARLWVEAGNRLELWSWSKAGARGKAKRWTLRVETYAEMIAAV